MGLPGASPHAASSTPLPSFAPPSSTFPWPRRRPAATCRPRAEHTPHCSFALPRQQHVVTVVAGVAVASLAVFQVQPGAAGSLSRRVLRTILALVLGFIAWLLLRVLLQLRNYFSKLLPIEVAAPTDTSSHFTAVQDPRTALAVHYRHKKPLSASRATQFLAFHGFGASSLSFDDYARTIPSQTSFVAMDRPGFGFTQRPTSNNLFCYTDYFLANRIAPQVAAAAFGNDVHGTVVMAHSLGAQAATLFTANMIRRAGPSAIRALVLIAPAIIAPSLPSDDSARPTSPFTWVILWLRYVLCLTLDLTSPLVKGFLVFSFGESKSWRRGLTFAWFKKTGVSDAVVDRYQSPGRCAAWPAGILRFVKAAVLGPAALHPGVPAHRLDAAGELAKVVDAGVPVLIVTGADDFIVPTSNSKRLASANPGAQIEVIESCGHIPHEEDTEEFAQIVQTFLAGLH